MTSTWTVDPTERPPFPRAALLRIWIAPRETMRAILASDPGRSVWVLGALMGIGQARVGPDATLGSVVGLIVYGVIIGIPAWLIGSVLVSWAGQRLGGTGDLTDVKAAIAWGSVPFIAYQVLAIALSFVASGTVGSCLSALLGLGLGIWAAVVYVGSIAEAHQVSVLRAIAILVVAMLPLFAIGIVAALPA